MRTRSGRAVHPPDKLRNDSTYLNGDEATLIESLLQQGKQEDITLASVTAEAMQHLKHDHISLKQALRGPEQEQWKAAIFVRLRPSLQMVLSHRSR